MFVSGTGPRAAPGDGPGHESWRNHHQRPQEQVRQANGLYPDLAWIQDKTPPAVIKGTDSELTPSKVPGRLYRECIGGADSRDLRLSLRNQQQRHTDEAHGESVQCGCTNPPNGDTNALSVLVPALQRDCFIADFGQVGVTKTGGIVFTGTAEVLDRNGFGTIPIKSNVKPLGK